MEIKYDINLVLLQIRSIPVGPGLSSLATLLVNRQMSFLMMTMDRSPINHDNGEHHNS